MCLFASDFFRKWCDFFKEMVNVSSVRDDVDDDVGMTIKSGITLDHCQLCECV